MVAKPNLHTDKVYVAFSGGCDSTALLILCKQWFKEVIAVHFNHGWENSTKIEVRAKEICLKLQIPYIVGTATTPCEGETAARNARFHFFDSLPNNAYLLLGHNLEEQIETIIFQLARGSKNPSINAQSDRKTGSSTLHLVRPLLNTSKETLKTICQDAQVEWVEDPTNTDTSIARNRIRHEILPTLATLNPNAFEHINQFFAHHTQHAKEINTESLSVQEVAELVALNPLPCKKLHDISNTSLSKVLKQWLEAQGASKLEEHHLKRCVEVARGARIAWPLPNNRELRRSKQCLYFQVT